MTLDASLSHGLQNQSSSAHLSYVLESLLNGPAERSKLLSSGNQAMANVAQGHYMTFLDAPDEAMFNTVNLLLSRLRLSHCTICPELTHTSLPSAVPEELSVAVVLTRCIRRVEADLLPKRTLARRNRNAALAEGRTTASAVAPTVIRIEPFPRHCHASKRFVMTKRRYVTIQFTTPGPFEFAPSYIGHGPEIFRRMDRAAIM